MFEGIYKFGKHLFTLNLSPGFRVYGEKLVKKGRKEYRQWNPYRSKLCAAILKGIKEIGIKPSDKVLYLGAASGTTASHVSDIVGKNGYVFCLDIAPRVVRDLVMVCEKRENMFPLLADANKVEEYENLIPQCDVIYQDIAAPNQVEILLKNSRFLKKGGYVLLAVKARSIDVTKKPKDIFKEVERELEEHLSIIDRKRLEPFEKDHMFYVMRF
ncbi:fibrillarin-like rRNA/tRNA 2'-O-methyltransferase [Nanoarchaeota archaeon]|nr:MAG: fibrillarin-like rRNA/tRNA 2'-O-methyltransferase [Nanoarchaeota archaeon]